MRIHWMKPIVIVISLVLVADGCGTKPTALSTFPTGTFINDGWAAVSEVKQEVDANGVMHTTNVWSITYESSGKLKDMTDSASGSYSADLTNVTFIQLPDSMPCGDRNGVYKWRLDGTMLTFELVRDECYERQAVILSNGGNWARQESTLSPTPTPIASFPRRFHVVGNLIVDDNGRPMIFRGMAPIDPFYQIMYASLPPDHGVWSEHHYQVMAEWGANIIRIPIAPDNWRKYIHRHDDSVDKALGVLDQTIAWAAENKMYVIIDYHSIGWPPLTLKRHYYQPYVGAETSPTEMMDFWNIISKRYADNNVVAFYELFNEPETLAQSEGKIGTVDEWWEWRDFMQEVVKVVRANDPDKIILVGGMNNAYDLSFVAANPVEGSNIAYATHPYSPRTKPPWDEAFGHLSSQYPVFATELGYNQSDFPDSDVNGTPYHQAIIDYLEAHRLSWTAWCFDADWQTTLLKDIKNYTPSPSGEYFRSRMLELNQLPQP